MGKTLQPYAEEELNTTIFQALGEASYCWENLAGAGIFESTRCKEIGDRLVERVKEITGFDKPNLGLATNEQLETELRVRRELGHVDHNYRTIEED